MSKYADAYTAFRKAEREAVLFDNPDWHRADVHDERLKRLRAARKALRAATPARTAEGVSPAQGKATEALGNLRPTHADEVALIGNEWAKVEARLNAGYNLAKIIETADRQTLAAIVDRMPTRLIVTSPEPDDAIAEIEDMAVERLASMGDLTALASFEARSADQIASAWGAILEEVAEQHSVSTTASTMLFNADPDEWRMTVAQTPDDDHMVEKAIRDVSANLDFGGSPLLNAPGGSDGAR